MDKFTSHTGVAAVLDRANVDTDQIIPKQFLKRVERTGFGQFLFFDWRFLNDGAPNPEFELNAPLNSGATILLAGRNFGSGSSREHAPWSLADYGFRTVIAPTFGDIFYSNCLQNGFLPVRLSEEAVSQFMKKARESHEAGLPYQLTVDLGSQSVYDDSGLTASFEIDPFKKHCLLNGLDDIGLTLQNADSISRFEADRPNWMPGTAA